MSLLLLFQPTGGLGFGDGSGFDPAPLWVRTDQAWWPEWLPGGLSFGEDAYLPRPSPQIGNPIGLLLALTYSTPAVLADEPAWVPQYQEQPWASSLVLDTSDYPPPATFFHAGDESLTDLASLDRRTDYPWWPEWWQDDEAADFYHAVILDETGWPRPWEPASAPTWTGNNAWQGAFDEPWVSPPVPPPPLRIGNPIGLLLALTYSFPLEWGEPAWMPQYQDTPWTPVQTYDAGDQWVPYHVPIEEPPWAPQVQDIPWTPVLIPEGEPAWVSPGRVVLDEPPWEPAYQEIPWTATVFGHVEERVALPGIVLDEPPWTPAYQHVPWDPTLVLDTGDAIVFMGHAILDEPSWTPQVQEQPWTPVLVEDTGDQVVFRVQGLADESWLPTPPPWDLRPPGFAFGETGYSTARIVAEEGNWWEVQNRSQEQPWTPVLIQDTGDPWVPVHVPADEAAWVAQVQDQPWAAVLIPPGEEWVPRASIVLDEPAWEPHVQTILWTAPLFVGVDFPAFIGPGPGFVPGNFRTFVLKDDTTFRLFDNNTFVLTDDNVFRLRGG